MNRTALRRIPRRPAPWLGALVAVALGASACASGGIGASDPFVRGNSGAAEMPTAVGTAARPLINLTGVVTGGPEGDVLAGATVTLRPASGAGLEPRQTGAQGTFEFLSLPPGIYTVIVSATGHRPLEQRVDVQGLPPVRLQVHLEAEGDDEDTAAASIVARPDPLQTSGFYSRSEREAGSFLLASDIRRRGGRTPAELVLSLAGFRTLPQSATVVGRRGCPPTLFIDGVDVGDTRQIDFLVTVASIAALEAYPGSSPPAIFAGMNSQCGAVVVWTPRGGD